MERTDSIKMNNDLLGEEDTKMMCSDATGESAGMRIPAVAQFLDFI
jgi:hypothetical protein